MLPAADPSINAGPLNLDALFSGLVRKTSEGGETIDYLSAVLAFGRCIAAGPDLSVLLHDACELAGLVLQADMLFIAQLTADTKELMPQIASFDENRNVVVQTPDRISSAPDVSMAAHTLYSADVIESEDIVAERRFTDLLLRRLQMGSGVFAPLCSHNRAFGAFGLVRKRTGPFSADETRFTSGISQLLASYLAQLEAEKQLLRHDTAMQAKLNSVENLILSLDSQGVVRQMNAAAVRISGFRDRELRDRPFWNTLIVPADSEIVATVFRQASRPGSGATFDARLLSKEGQHRAVQWSLRAVEIDENSPRSYVLSGLDQTELVECKKELEKYRKIAHKAAAAAEETSTKTGGAGKPAEPTGTEKRSSPRRDFNYFQRIAPIVDDRIPDDDEFIKVVCCDISAGGFSFLSEEPPTFSELVISLGTPPRARRVIAKVVRLVRKDMDGQPTHLVGCQFVGRMND